MTKTNAQRQKEWRERQKKEKSRRISEERVRLGECIQEKTKQNWIPRKTQRCDATRDGEKARE